MDSQTARMIGRVHTRHKLTGTLIALLLWPALTRAEELRATPSDVAQRLAALRPGDVLRLAAGDYPPLVFKGLVGSAERPIRVLGAPELASRVVGRAGRNTIELRGCHHLQLVGLAIDSAGHPGADGLKAMGAPSSHVTIEGCALRGCGGSQQTCGISTKTPCWGWRIVANTIVEPGTGLYLGDSDGSAPFVAGLVRGNVVARPIGYCMQIKRQNARPAVAGLPVAPATTRICHNRFLKDDRASPDGARPCLLLGAWPPSGPGADDRYEVYGNVFFANPTESLLQLTGRATVHDNVFASARLGILAREHHGRPLLQLRCYHNTFVRVQTMLKADRVAGLAVGGNLVIAGERFGSRDVAAGPERIASADPRPGKLDPRPRRGPPRASLPAALGAAFKQDTDARFDLYGQRKRTAGYAGASVKGARGAAPLTLSPAPLPAE